MKVNLLKQLGKDISDIDESIVEILGSINRYEIVVGKQQENIEEDDDRCDSVGCKQSTSNEHRALEG